MSCGAYVGGAAASSSLVQLFWHKSVEFFNQAPIHNWVYVIVTFHHIWSVYSVSKEEENKVLAMFVKF